MASLTIDLDDQASDGLDAINAALDQSAVSAQEAAKGADLLTASQQRQLIVINQANVGWSKMGDTSIRVFGDVAVAGVHAYESIEVAAINSTKAIVTTAINAGASVAKYAIVTSGAVSAVKAIWGSHTAAVQKDAAETANAGRIWQTYALGVAAGTVVVAESAVGHRILLKAIEKVGVAGVKSLAGIGPEVAAGYIAWEAYSAVLARTGVKTVELADGTTKLESNLDRTNAAFSKFSSDISRDFSEAGQVISDWWNTPLEWPDILKDAYAEIDRVVTRDNDVLIENIGHVNKAYKDGVVNLRSWFVEMTTGGGDAYKKEIENLRSLQDWHTRMQKQREIERDGFALLGKANAELEAKDESRAEVARIGSIKTIDSVQGEIIALKQKASATAQAGKFDEDAQKAYMARLELLESRKIAIEKETSNARTDNHRKLMEQYTEEDEAIDKQIKAAGELFDAEQKRLQKLHGMKQDLEGTAQKESFNTQQDAAKDHHEAAKSSISEQMKLRGDKESDIKKAMRDMDRQFAEQSHAEKIQQINEESKQKLKATEEARKKLDDSGIDGVARAKELIKIQEDEAKILFDRRKAYIAENGRFERETNKQNIQAALAGEEAKFEAEKKRIEKSKAMQEQLKQAFDPKKMMEQQDPQKVFKQFQEDRARDAQQKQADKDVGLFNKAQAGDKSAEAKYIKNQEIAAARARNQAAKDANNGNVSDGEIQKAQGEVAQQTVAAMQGQGVLNGNQAQMMTDALKTIADVQQAQANIIALNNKLIAFQKGQKNIAVQQVNTTQNQQGALN